MGSHHGGEPGIGGARLILSREDPPSDIDGKPGPHHGRKVLLGLAALIQVDTVGQQFLLRRQALFQPDHIIAQLADALGIRAQSGQFVGALTHVVQLLVRLAQGPRREARGTRRSRSCCR